MSLREDVLHHATLFNIRLNPDLGQHFLVSKNILELEVSVANVMPDDVVLDIGAGFGYLTEVIAKAVKKVYALEVDERILEVLKFRLREEVNSGKVVPILGDALEVNFPEDVTAVISNPPYHIISPLIVKVLRTYFLEENFKCAVMILQREFVRRLFTRPGSPYWGRISAAFRYFAKGKIIRDVPRHLFFPSPEVDSVLVKFWPVHREHLVPFDIYERVTAIVFTAPKKKLKSVLRNYLKSVAGSRWRVYLNELSKQVPMEKRVREVTVEELEKIARMLFDKGLL